MTKLEITLIVVVIGLVLFVSWSFYEKHEGAVACVDADKVAVAKQEAANAAILVNQNQAIAQEKQAYEDALLQPVSAPVVRLCFTPPAMPQAPTTRPNAPASPSLPAVSAPSALPGPDIGRPLVQVGHDADAQVGALISYIQHVCLQ